MIAITPQKNTFYRRRGDISVKLDLSALDHSAQGGWRQFIAGAGKAVGIGMTVSSFRGLPPDDGSHFVYVANSAGLSRKLLLHMPCVYIQPHARPLLVDTFIYGKLLSMDAGLAEGLRPVCHDVTLVSSVFRGDEFLPGFLENCAQLKGYRDCEHLLIRAASPGNEHALLVRHVHDWPSAAYLNLSEDPGLYEVWNGGVRLATGRYISNANIDDRRAPDHLTHLTKVLDQHPEVDAASTALRVTSRRNLGWEDSADCEVMFGSVGDKVYSANDLFKMDGAGLASRNLLHCMPVWRRTLHLRSGAFNEKKYGTSADWAFWLRAGSLGSKFHFSRKPLGLYLRDEGSYWRRSPRNTQFDAHVCRKFGHLAAAAGSMPQTDSTDHCPFSLIISFVLEVLYCGACLEGIGLLLNATVQAKVLGASALALLNKVAAQWLGSTDFSVQEAGYRDTLGADQQGEIALFNTLVDLIHAYEPQQLGGAAERIGRTLGLACVDFYECSGRIRGLLALALLARRGGDLAGERQLLQNLHEKNPVTFWAEVQLVYRFTRPLTDLGDAVSGIARHYVRGGTRADVHLWYYPLYSGNSYQNLLYAPLDKAGAEVKGTLSEAEFLSAVPQPEKDNILHVHWLNRLFGSGTAVPSVLGQRAMDFLEGLSRQKQRGFQIYWTIHNSISHESADPASEVSFRQELYRLADKVFVHHPLAAHQLEWLPDHDKLYLCEHGNYGVQNAKRIPRSNARRDLGIGLDDFVVTHIGHLRDYKGLAEHLPVLYRQLAASPRLKVMIAGRISSRSVRSWLDEHPHPRVIIRDGFLSDEELLTVMRASDMGFLSYSSVLTSGTLFHWFTCGRPVLAPVAGTIPAYVVDGWNGFTYRDGTSLQHVLSHCVALPRSVLDALDGNAQATARQLQWELW